MVPKPGVNDPDFFAFPFLKDLLFTNSNSILNQMLVNKMKLAYAISGLPASEYNLYSSYCQIYVSMDAQLGNVKVKKVIAQEIQEIIDGGVDEERIKDYLSNIKASEALSSYHNEYIAEELGMAEIYLNDYRRYDVLIEFEKSVATPQQLQQVAKKYFNPDGLKIINIKPVE